MNESKLYEDFNDEDLFREVFNKGYDAGHKEGYKRGKADIKAEAIPVDWIEKKIQWLREHNSAFYNPVYFLETMLAEWKEEQNG